MTKKMIKVLPFNFIPIQKNPWGGRWIAKLKKRYFSDMSESIPEFIGESWEISTDRSAPSLVQKSENKVVSLEEEVGHVPLLLKWLHAQDVLSVQLHPPHHHALLKEDEGGKPEAWLVLDVESGGFVYLGFKESITKEQIIEHLLKDEVELCLHKYYPKKFDYISVPTGCVHAVGPGVFLLEPQSVLPKKSGKTWRISDWKRKYDNQGVKSATGSPRDLHTREALEAIDWLLPRGFELEKKLIKNIQNKERFLGNDVNPFSVQIFSQVGTYSYKPLNPGVFSLVSVWAGKVILRAKNEELIFKGGESGYIPAHFEELEVVLESHLDSPCVAFFSLFEA